MHQLRDSPRAGHEEDRHHKSDHGKQSDAGADGPPAFLRLSFSDLPSETYRGPHGKACDEIRHGHHDLGAGGDRRHVRRDAEPADDQKIHRAVHCLKKQRGQHRQRETHQGHQDASSCKIVFFFFSHLSVPHIPDVGQPGKQQAG